MFHIVLYQPEIPPNTGNIIRLCANTGTKLHLIHPLGFELEDKALRRAGLDYHEWADVVQHVSFADFLHTIKPKRLFTFSTKGKRSYTDIQYKEGDTMVFGPETRGLPDDILASSGNENTLRLPMKAGSRSLNLSNTVAIVIYQAWSDQAFKGSLS